MKNLLYVLLCTIILFANQSFANKKIENADIFGFYIQQDLIEAIEICENDLKYSINVYLIEGNVYAIECTPKYGKNTTDFKLLTRGKPIHVLLLVINDQVFGVHALFTHKNVYKKALVNFVTSGVMKDKKINNDILKDVQSYVNLKEKWIGWYSDVSEETIDENKKLKSKIIYMIHMEYLVETEMKDPNLEIENNNEKI